MSDLIVSRFSPAGVKRAGHMPLLAAMLRSRLVKSAQLGEAGKGRQHRFASSIADMDASRANALAVDRANAARGRRGLTGDKYYDNLPDVAERRGYENAKADYDNYLKHRDDIIQQQNIADIRQKMDAEGPTKSWGDTTTGRTLAGIVSAPVHGLATLAGSLGLGINNWMEGRRFGEGQDEYLRLQRESFGDVAHDVANNFQLQANAARHGAGTVARAANHYLRPSTWKSDAESVAQAQARKNEWHNADLAHHERASRIFDNFTDSTLKDDKSKLGLLNYGLNTAVGEFAGAEAATMGIGGAAKGVGKGITAGTRAASGAVRGAGAAADGAGLGARALQGARNMAAKGIDAMGDTVAMPFNAVGTMATPIASARRAVPAAGRDLWHTVRNGVVNPSRDIYSLIRHPQHAWQSFRATPWQHAWRGATYPVRWAWNTAKPIGRHAFSDKGFKAMAAGQAIYGLSNGDYGGAGSALGDMAAYGALGPWYMPFAVAQGMAGGDKGDGYGYA